MRNQILKLIYELPASMEHVKSTDLGRTLNLLQTSPKELSENKKLIQTIKDKWSRIICQTPVEYSDLEHCEQAYNNLPLSLRNTAEEEEPHLGKRREQTEDEMNQNLSYRFIRPGSMGYNFSVRPSSAHEKNYNNRSEKQIEFDKYLMRIRRGNKKN